MLEQFFQKALNTNTMFLKECIEDLDVYSRSFLIFLMNLRSGSELHRQPTIQKIAHLVFV